MKAAPKLLFVFGLIYCESLLYSQELIATGGDFHQKTYGSISYTIGEIAIETFTKPNIILTQGFNQTNLIAVAVNEPGTLNFEISAFPNPTRDCIYLKLPLDKLDGAIYHLYDLNGKTLQKVVLIESETKISFRNLDPSTYFIKVTKGNVELKTFKIIKH